MSTPTETDIKLERDVAVVKTILDTVKSDISEIKQILSTFKDDFVTQKEFEPIKRGFYGLVAAVVIELLSIIGGIILWLLTK